MAIPIAKLKAMLPGAAMYAGGAGTGAYLGNQVIPGLIGYEDNPGAVNLSTMLNAGTGVALVNSLRRKALGKELKLLLAGAAGGELIPKAVDTLDSGIESLDATTEAMKEQAAAADNTLATKQLSELWKQPITKGVVGGGAAGALAGLGTGLLRPRTDAEVSGNTSRVLMALKDMGVGSVAGGLGGGLLGSTKSSEMTKEVTATGKLIPTDKLKELVSRSKSKVDDV